LAASAGELNNQVDEQREAMRFFTLDEQFKDAKSKTLTGERRSPHSTGASFRGDENINSTPHDMLTNELSANKESSSKGFENDAENNFNNDEDGYVQF